MKSIVITTISIILILGSSFNIFALSVNKPIEGETLPESDINIKQKLNGDFEELTYIITDTGATSGIRYRTTGITFELNGIKGTLKATELTNYKPTPGEKITSIVSIDTADLVKIFGEENKAKVEEALKNPENLKIGANIEVYNASTGKTLTTITDEDYINGTIYEKIKKYGFNGGHAEDMRSRWHGHEQEPSQPVYDYVPDPEPEEIPKSKGLRPGILVAPPSWDKYKTTGNGDSDTDYNGYYETIDTNDDGY